jgi:hypothetical protein
MPHNTRRSPVAGHDRASKTLECCWSAESKPNATDRQDQHHFDALAEGYRLAVWVELRELLGRLQQRVGHAVRDFEHGLVYDDALVDELKAEVAAFSSYAAAYRRRRR